MLMKELVSAKIRPVRGFMASSKEIGKNGLCRSRPNAPIISAGVLGLCYRDIIAAGTCTPSMKIQLYDKVKGTADDIR